MEGTFDIQSLGILETLEAFQTLSVGVAGVAITITMVIVAMRFGKSVLKGGARA